jgi:hypothetical protein
MIPHDLDDYRRLVARVDDHAERITEAWAESLACRSGCAGCCQRSLSVSAVEAASIRCWIQEHGLAPREGEGACFISPLTIVDPDQAEPCAMLDSGGACRIYPARPIICRTHGLPVAVPDPQGGRQGDTCPLNFTQDGGLGVVPSEDFLDLTTLDVVLVAIDLRFTQAAGRTPGERTSLAELSRS